MMTKGLRVLEWGAGCTASDEVTRNGYHALLARYT